MSSRCHRGADPKPRPHLEALEDRLSPAGDMVLRWNGIALDAIRADLTAPPVAARSLAIVHVAIHDAVNAITGYNEPYAVTRHGPNHASPQAAVAAAAHRTLVDLFPAQQGTLDRALVASLAEVPNGRAENEGVALGRSVAQHILALRRHDGADRVVSYVPATRPGAWQPTPPAFLPALLPHWPFVTPFTMRRGAQFRPPSPPALTSAEYTASFNEVKRLGGSDSALRTPEQTQIAHFWINGPGTATPPGHWNEAAQVVAAGQGNTLAENARLFALLNLALADAGIVSWDAKYTYNLWRPVTAIHAADTDGNPATAADRNWAPLITTPPFPAYTSGHSTFSAAAAAVLVGFFGRDNIAFTLESETPDAADRTFTSFTQAARESGLSRIYGGIHWSFDDSWGLATGATLGRFVVAHYLRPDSSRAPEHWAGGSFAARSDGAGLESEVVRLGGPGKAPSFDAGRPPSPVGGIAYLRVLTESGLDRVEENLFETGQHILQPSDEASSSRDLALDALFADPAWMEELAR